MTGPSEEDAPGGRWRSDCGGAPEEQPVAEWSACRTIEGRTTVVTGAVRVRFSVVAPAFVICCVYLLAAGPVHLPR